MSSKLSALNRRIAWAVAISVLLHGLVLWGTRVKLPEHEKQLPALLAKLVPLPKSTGKIAAHKHLHKSTPPPPVAPPIPEIATAASEPLAASEPVAESSPIAASAPLAESFPLAASAPQLAEPILAASAPVVDDTEELRPPLPKHAQLRFSISVGQNGFKAGESLHTLDINDGRYILKADFHTTGLASVFKVYHMEQTSTGTATAQTLKPETFTDEITQSSGKQSNRADFDWANHVIRFSNGSQVSLPQQAQDILSILYQFPPMSQQEDAVSINIATGKRFETARFEIDFEEQLKTSMGTLQTVHFRKRRAAKEEGLEIWFAREYRLLPVKIRHIDRDGKIDGEAVISDIRVSDE